MRVVFAGTPDFARSALEALHRGGHEIPLVLTQPDRPAGRGLKLQPSPVKAFAEEQGIDIAQPRSLRLDGKFPDDAAAAGDVLRRAQADVMVVAAYGLILPQWVLDLPCHGCLNIHASLLPRWRGAAPIHRAIEAGDRSTGITIMQMDAGLDTGDMLLVRETPIEPGDTTGTLHDRLAALGGRAIVEALAGLTSGPLPRTPQSAEGICYARKIDKAEAAIDWRQPAAVIERRLRAFDPFPGGHTTLGDETLKCWRGEVAPAAGVPGAVLVAGDDGITVACGEQALRLTELQRPGSRRLTAAEFLRGRPLEPGSRFATPAD